MDRRRRAGQPWEVLADVERVMRFSIPLPHTATRTDDIGVLLELIGQIGCWVHQSVLAWLPFIDSVTGSALNARRAQLRQSALKKIKQLRRQSAGLDPRDASDRDCEQRLLTATGVLTGS